ncbi:hypothetical protein I0C86_23200 [Plantactinospora sp. S1510]|uniref:Lipoprotein n=1 Tax=Plantactinospora alkalitolerans TaxID=2789879 RepID=A0ABS0H0I7_9ACTN|nr:hypothetical protein [Plantactinospora alkalitolerans]MBF9131849.1 hypothetical protein [Plantactinospora alkalitolerans]
MRKSLFKAGYIALSFTVVAVLAAGCQPDGGKGTAAAPSSGASAGSPSAAAPSATPAGPTNSKEVCAAVLDVFLDGSVKIADDSVKAIEKGLNQAAQAKQIRTTLASLAEQLEVQAEKANDPEIKSLIEKMVARLESGAKSSDPVKFLETDLVQVGTMIDEDCAV